MLEKIKEFWNDIESYDSISIFRHTLPDPDALGSQFGLAHIIKENWPNKTINLYGKMSDERFEELFQFDFPKVSKDITKDLVIVLDTGNSPRIDGDDWKKGAKIIKVDHHENGCDDYGQLELVNSKWVATSEAIMFLFNTNGKLKMNVNAATSLFTGIVADSGRFMYENTSPDTFNIAADLIKAGAEASRVYDSIYTMSINQFKLENYIRTHLQEIGDVGFCILDQGKEIEFGVPYANCKNLVYTLNGIVELPVWVLATFDSEISKWRVSIRSRGMTVSDVAAEFGGGGHRLAAATRLDEKIQVLDLINKLSENLEEYKKNNK